MGCFLLVRRLKSVARASGGHTRPGHFLPMMEGVMSIAVFILVILLFGFDLNAQGALKHRSRNFTWL